MFKNSFVVSIKSDNGNYFREDSDIIKIPFMTDYSIYLKNLNSRKAVVKVSIDGVDVLDGKQIVVQPNTSIDLEGFLRGGLVNNKFRFIKKTQEIEDFKGSSPEDGIIRVEFDFEKESQSYYWYAIPVWRYYEYYDSPTRITWTSTGDSGTIYGSQTVYRGNSVQTNYTVSADIGSKDFTGITVAGKETLQKFQEGYIGEMENNPTVITFRLIGTNEEPTFTKDRIRCTTCGRTSKSSNKFCSNCGTALLIK